MRITKPNSLKFTPLEFETTFRLSVRLTATLLKFTPLEFETMMNIWTKMISNR